jgi:formylglycine-generating enzyme required for sulfatase activity
MAPRLFITHSHRDNAFVAWLDPFLRAQRSRAFHANYQTAFMIFLRALGVRGAVAAIDASVPPAEPDPVRLQPQAGMPQFVPSQVIVSPNQRVELPVRMTNQAGQEMILIPAGEFLMGSPDSEENAEDDEKPQHTVYLDAFYISRYPVTNAEYKKFIAASGQGAPGDWENGKIPNGKENHPVVMVRWDEAVAYCQWVGGRLPTEAEWEKVASWDAAKKGKRKYAWGDAFDSNKCNTRESGIGDTTAVGKYSPQGDSFYDVSDMAGNVWQWCADRYDDDYYKNSPRENPQGPDSGTRRVVRSGSFFQDQWYARCASRDENPPYVRGGDLGFRVAASP